MFNLPPGVAYIINGRRVTYADVGKAKKEKQRRQLACKREDSIFCEERIAVYIWTFYNDPDICPFYSGWHCYIYGWHKHKHEWWVGGRGDIGSSLQEMTMTAFPLGIEQSAKNFYQWKEAFAKAYPIVAPRISGKAKAWAVIDGCKILSIEPVTKINKPKVIFEF
jgi:hypothetical protein